MIIIDFEASSLRKKSHPIEVAWGDGPETIKSFLLNPDYLPGWTDWSPKSYEFHGITRAELRQSGVDPRRVAKQMVKELGNQTVYSDEPQYDNWWKHRLLADSGYDPSVIQIRDLTLYLKHRIQTVPHCKTFNDLLCSFECVEPPQHRAASDVLWLFRLVEYVEQNSRSQSGGDS